MGRTKKPQKFAVMKKMISHKALKHYKEEVLNPNKRDHSTSLNFRETFQVSVPSGRFFPHNSSLVPSLPGFGGYQFHQLLHPKIDLEKGMMDCLYAKMHSLVSRTVSWLKDYLCVHKGTYADDCLVDRFTLSNLLFDYFFCDIPAQVLHSGLLTCDRDLKRRFGKLVIMYVTQRKYSIENLPEATIMYVELQDTDKRNRDP